MARVTIPTKYHGSKQRWADDVWEKFGDVDVFVEPFCGSAAVWLNCPYNIPTVFLYDVSGLICNYLRAVKHNPDAVIDHSVHPIVHQDLNARTAWLTEWEKENAEKMNTDPHWYDPQAAGWWWWVQEITIHGHNRQKYRNIPRRSGNPGLRHRLSNGTPMAVREGLRVRLLAVRDKLSMAAIINRSWEFAVRPAGLYLTRAYDKYPTPRAVFLDPPYKSRWQGIYKGQVPQVAHDSYAWAVQNGDNPRLRVAYCCGSDDFECPDGWTTIGPHQYPGCRNENEGEVIYFSPACLGELDYKNNSQRSLFHSPKT